ncbi:ABC transporter permease [Butyrivibrio sp. M55]|uniref:ABC transporter permease n=1 Tax=Butyrivibrio sp. M55 TaxID=1855323 RepID=UPI0008E5B444|nr:ABC transporter permease [Butyrivibrio sp. M55]SFU37225.1 hypothetical protein SAMN05216540_101348 [Butyrivibrio sp. M55]
MDKEKVSEFNEKAKNKIKTFLIEAKVPLILITILLLIDLILGIITRFVVGSMPDQNVIGRLSVDDKWAQVSVFYAQNQCIDENAIKKLEYDFKNKMVDEGGINEKKLNFSSCYSAQGSVAISYDKDKEPYKARAIGVGGEFFLFHPLNFVTGNAFKDDPTMPNYIVLDKQIAWDMFGSSDICGEVVYINNAPHYIAGVIDREKGRFNDAAGLKEPVIYMSYESLSRFGDIYSGRTVEKEISETGQKAKFGGINCYEIACPNPVEGIVCKYITESCGLDGGSVHICENSERFKPMSLLEVAASFGTRSMWQKAIYYPYWENIARGYEDVLSVLFIIGLFLKVSAVVTVILFVKNCYTHRETDLHGLMEKLADKKYELEVKMNDRKKKKRISKWEKDNLSGEQ